MSEHPIVWRTKVANALGERGLLTGAVSSHDGDYAAQVVSVFDDPELEVIANACEAAVAFGATQARREVVEQRVAITRAWRLIGHLHRGVAFATEMERAVAAAVLVLGEAGIYGDNEDLDALLAETAEADEWQHVSSGPHTAEASTVSFETMLRQARAATLGGAEAETLIKALRQALAPFAMVRKTLGVETRPEFGTGITLSADPLRSTDIAWRFWEAAEVLVPDPVEVIEGSGG